MARPTKKEQDMIRVRNEAIENLVSNKGFSQAEVARCFNMHRASVHQIIKEAESPMKLGDKLLKEYVFKKIREEEKKTKSDDYISVLGLSWRFVRPAFKDYLMTEELGKGYSVLWDEMYPGEFKNKWHPTTPEEFKKVAESNPTRTEDIVITHKGSVVYVIRFGETFAPDEYSGVTKIAVPTGVVLALNEITDLSIYEV